MKRAIWTFFAIGYLTLFAYAVSLMVYQFGSAFTGNVHVVGLIAAILVLALIVYMLFFKKYKESTVLTEKVRVK